MPPIGRVFDLVEGEIPTNHGIVNCQMGKVVKLPARPPRPLPGNLTGPALEAAEWLQATAQRHGISYQAWCEQAGVSPSTIQKFMATGYPVPKAATLVRLAEAIGTHKTTGFSPAMVDIPVVDARMAASQGLEAAMAQAETTTRAAARFEGHVGVRIDADTASLAGILPGDLVLVDPSAPLRDGALAVVVRDDETAVYQVLGRILLPMVPGTPKPLLRENCHVLGVAVQVQRDLA
jgi:SOS-response transcriptional repressor LexA